MTLSESEKRPDKREKPLTKVIIRRLPPTMTKEQFLNQVSPVSDYNYLYHVKGDMSLGENAFSRVYINFVCPEDVYTFKEKFDNYVFVDSKGHEYNAVVEFAPFQKIPKKRGKARMDPKCNTIEEDTYYLDFVANLNKPIEPNEKPEYTMQLSEKNDGKKKDISTPLLEYIKSKRAQKLKFREVRREERERKRKEFERKKEHGKYYDENSPVKNYSKKHPYGKSTQNEFVKDKEQTKPANTGNKYPKIVKERIDEIKTDEKDRKNFEKFLPENKQKERKPEEKKEKKEIKPRFPKKEYTEKKDDYSHRDYKSKHYDEPKKEEPKNQVKKIKKYSERREERKLEAQKAEQQRKLDEKAKEFPTNENSNKNIIDEKNTKPENDTVTTKPKSNNDKDGVAVSSSQQSTITEKDSETSETEKKKESDEKSESGSSKRIRNKDRPTIPLYRPGMLSKRRQTDDDSSQKGDTATKIDSTKE